VFAYDVTLAPGDHSLFGVVKHIMIFTGNRPSIRFAAPYYAVAVCVGFGLLYLLRIRNLPELNQILAFTVACIALPFVSFDYTLVHLYVPFWFLVRRMSRETELTFAGSSNLLLPFAILFTPQSYLFITHAAFGLAGNVKAFALLWMLRSSIQSPLPDKQANSGPGETNLVSAGVTATAV
jgi:hypothetical protein